MISYLIQVYAFLSHTYIFMLGFQSSRLDLGNTHSKTHSIISNYSYVLFDCAVVALRHFVLQQHLTFESVYVLEACVITFYVWCLIVLYSFAAYMINKMDLYWSHDFMC